MNKTDHDKTGHDKKGQDETGHDTPLVPPEAHTRSFRRTRQARRLELVEDYVELIADLIDAAGEARQTDIAQRLGVAQPTVAKTLKRLAAEGLVSQRPYRGVFLTDEGRRLAAASRDRHRIVETFLRDIGISPETARVDAEGIEHHVSAESLLAFKAFSDAKAAAVPPPGPAEPPRPANPQ